MILGTGMVCGQDYPNKPIHIFAGTPGGGNDFVARLIAQGISGPLGQTVVIENRGQVALSAEPVAKAPPDGHTLMVVGASLWVTPLMQKMSYDVVRDFSPISAISRDVFVVAVHPSLPVKSVKELIALAKAKPGELNEANGGTGGSQHLATELFKSMAGVNMVHVPYKGSSQAVTAAISGEVQLILTEVGLAMPHVKKGRLRALAVTSGTSSALVPELPTAAATGLPGYEAVGFTGMLAPAKTPEAVINRLNQEVVRFLNRADVKEQMISRGSEVVASSPAQFAATIRTEIAKTAKVIKDARIKVDL